MRSGLLSLLVVLLAAAPAAAAPCRKTDEGPRASITQSGTYAERSARSSVTICLRRSGRTRVIRASIVRSPRGARGRYLSGAAASKTELAYVDARVGPRGGPDSIVATVLDMRTLRVARRVTFLRGRGLRSDFPDVAIADDGSLAVGLQEAWLRLARPGRRPKLLKEPYLLGLRVEDGTTLAWSTFYGEDLRYLDLERPPLRDGCPMREAFDERVRTDRLIVSEADNAVRVCDRTSGRDPVVAGFDRSSEQSSLDVSVVGATGAVAVVGIEQYEKGLGCYSQAVRVFDVDAGRVTRQAGADRCGLLPSPPRFGVPSPRVPTVLAPSGAPAWVVPPAPYSGSRDEHLAAVDGTTLRELDKGPPGSITDLRPTADGIAWRSGGAERTATLR
ncbi:MAG: hypothetical protein AVDCRST_MAG85-1137 [uncultured Solirubrobacteraceae bacterium]|uniref:Uncharacterized protein n=1 Tax=uncultured Solirubrobacteraceae bacterium TaxID=1162706 RepID=A0A6J4S942_9ACTN|nr:MAG: hypothetical protein AVDCRST_MAG85-1137 [uncultured Solirubrobacteraceae bacterium]